MSDDDLSENAKAFLHWAASLEHQNTGTLLSSANGRPVTFHSRGPSSSRPIPTAARNFSPEETLMTIGANDILSIKTTTLHNQIPTKELDLLPAWLSLVLTLMYEVGQGTSSKWWPFLNLLPSDFDTLMHWSNDELQELKGSHVLQRIGKLDAEEAFRELLFPLMRERSSLFGSLGQILTQNDEQELSAMSLAHRLATLVSMDSVDFEDDDDQEFTGRIDEDGLVEERIIKGLVPFVDLIRADSVEPNVQLTYNDNGSVSFVSISPIAIGEELVQSPGEIPNGELLRCYGVITNQDNPFDVAEIDWETLSECAKTQGLSSNQVSKREALAERWDALDDGYDLLRSPSSNGINSDLLLVSRLLATSSDDKIQELKEKQKRPSGKLERANATLLLGACEQSQRRYPTTLAEDIAILDHHSLSKRKMMAARVRLSEKQVLADNIAYLRSFLVDGGEIEEVESRNPKRQKT